MASLCRASSLNRTASSSLASARSGALAAFDVAAAAAARPPPPLAARRRSGVAAPATALAGGGLRRAGPGRRGGALAVRAAASGGGGGGGLAALRQDVARFLARHDPVATGMGALCVTAACVTAGGQDPGEALGVSAMATIAAMVANELLFMSGGGDGA
ncbi:MAG: hypothetical protein J3K34DRAFT_394069 [Monoraphidium minutum]|nr:MAG: hypothetical protein J3K34DRAFT_394069 [Monoraphidium minutum]